MQRESEKDDAEVAQNASRDFLAGLRKCLIWSEPVHENPRKGLLKISIAGRYLEKDLRVHLSPVDYGP